MFKVGITGGIGSGKTIATKVFDILGIPIYNADSKAKEIIRTNAKIQQQLIENYGKEIFLDNGILNKQKLSSIIFNNEKERQKVNSIIHPVVIDDYNNWTKNYSNCNYIIKEAAILFESGAYKDLDFIITVCSPIELRIQRIVLRDKISKSLIEKKIQSQLSDKEKIKLSDFVIHNNNKDLIINQILKIHNNILTIIKN